MSLKLADIIGLIVSKSGKSKDEVINLIEAKKKELSGYVTDEGAASLVARELDLDLYEKQPTPELQLSIRDLVTGMTGVSLNLKVIRVFPVRTFTRKRGGEGKVASLRGADSTGSIRVTFWDKHTQPIEDREIDENDIIRVINGRVRTGLREQLELHLGSGSHLMVNPPDVDPQDFPEVTIPQMKIASLEEGMNDVSVSGIVVAKIRKSTFTRGDSEGTVASLILRDDTGQTRLVLWDEQADWFEKLVVEETIRVENGYVRLNRNNQPELHIGRRGQIIQLKAGESLVDLSPAKMQTLQELKPGVLAASVGVVVVENQGLSTFTRRDGREGKRLVLFLADDTGQVRAVAWGQAAEKLTDLEVGDLLRLEGVSCRMGLRQELELHINESTSILRNPPDLEIKSPSSTTLEATQVSFPDKLLSDVSEGDFVTVRGTIVQVFQQRAVYDACPNCSRKVAISGKTITCPKCGKVPKSEPRLIAKIVIDDGTENMRVSFIGSSAEQLLGITGAEAKAIIEESGNENEPITRVEDTLLGKEVVLSGRIKLNNFSNKLEIAVNEISDANAVEVANRLIKKLEHKV